jgi:hypothetical protein
MENVDSRKSVLENVKKTGVYIEHPDGPLRFRWVSAPTSAELARLPQVLAQRIGRYLERQGLLECDAVNSYLAGDGLEAGPLDQLLGSSMMCKDARMSRAQYAQDRPTFRITVGPWQGRKVFTLQTLPACDEPFDDGVGKVAGLLRASCPPPSALRPSDQPAAVPNRSRRLGRNRHREDPHTPGCEDG